jgi:rod shape-determining protein MreC
VDLSRTPPPFFKQGPSAISRLVFFSALALLLMVADERLKVTGPIRAVLAAVLTPVESALRWPVDRTVSATRDVQALRDAQRERDEANARAREYAQRAQGAESLAAENARLRALLNLKPQQPAAAIAGQIVHESRDPFSRKFVLNKGSTQGIEAGMPVIDELGLIGQVTRVYLASSEVTVITDKDMAVPVQNTRTGVRSIAYGDASAARTLELRFMATNADVQEGDLLVTSGLDGIYPAGLAVAKVTSVERRAESAFARILCTPLSGLDRGRHVLVLPLAGAEVPPTPGLSSETKKAERAARPRPGQSDKREQEKR